VLRIRSRADFFGRLPNPDRWDRIRRFIKLHILNLCCVGKEYRHNFFVRSRIRAVGIGSRSEASKNYILFTLVVADKEYKEIISFRFIIRPFFYEKFLVASPYFSFILLQASHYYSFFYIFSPIISITFSSQR
jgi:hypothetical protein